MKILQVHNSYQYTGGEEAVVASEMQLLSNRGHTVELASVANDDVKSLPDKIKAAWQTPYSPTAHRWLSAELGRFRPDVVHVHNFFPLLSPSIYYACRQAGVPVVQTLHNYRLLCPSATFFRDGQVCEACLGKSFAWPGVVNGCYRGSRAGTAAVATMIAAHRFFRTYATQVDVLVALTEFARNKYIEGGLPAERLIVKPNFLEADPGIGPGDGKYALFVGRLSEEKGLTTLLEAWKSVAHRLPLKIVGDGPRQGAIREAAERTPGVEYLGPQPMPKVYELMGRATALVFPSEWYETFGRVIIEAYAKGTPVIASRLGAMAGLVEHRRTGLHFEPGDARDLACQVLWAVAEPKHWQWMRLQARLEFETRFTSEQNYCLLMQIYAQATGAPSIFPAHC